ncbi:RNA polymerase sigma factor [Persicirhabdus sediminis]|uniref:Sigma-70 family RNA polymerase sigma factor n=1 Tax=Persicirhabdus sediminis TaxID=454144 RepID=A0A8J7MJW0_9BACT|nr:sigma-70 family RNA polymerase sigma factor [Persicirhabdus sediminis]MBK1792343.1 sigma-70 family RNA polymerase sigma factor [Persicirhabdus sediminis]
MNFLHQFASKLLQGAIPPTTSGGHAPNEPSDNELVSKAQAGDTAAFDQLVTRHRGKVYAMVMNMIHNDADAWDLAQEIFLKAWRALPKFENRAKFSTWIFRITHNAVYDYKRKSRIHSDGELDDEHLSGERIDPGARTRPSQYDRPDQALEKSELGQRINHALEQLSTDHREVILLREVQGMEYKEIASAADCSLGTVMSRLFHARKKLQSLLSHEKPS